MRKPLAAMFLIGVLTACPTDIKPTPPSPPPPPGITVSGKVLDSFGQPGAFLPVLVGSKLTSSDANGSFSVSDVMSPYQLVVVQPDRKYAQVYQGVTRSDPIVLVFQGGSSLRKTALTVNFSGTGTGYSLMDVSNPVNANGGVSGVVKPGTSFTYDLQWNGGPTSFEGSVCAITHQGSEYIPTSITAFGESDGVFFQDGKPTSVGLSMAAVPNKTITGTVTVPPGFIVTAKTLGFACGGKAVRPSYPFTLDTGTETSFAYAAPVTTNTLYMEASAKKGDAYVDTFQYGVAPDASGVSLVLPEPIELDQPANNAVGITASAGFSWSPTSVGVSQVSISPSSSGPLTLAIYTSSVSITLPDLSVLGFSFPKGVTYAWRVSADTQVQTVNDALSGVPRDYLKSSSSSNSGQRQFTTAP